MDQVPVIQVTIDNNWPDVRSAPIFFFVLGWGLSSEPKDFSGFGTSWCWLPNLDEKRSLGWENCHAILLYVKLYPQSTIQGVGVMHIELWNSYPSS